MLTYNNSNIGLFCINYDICIILYRYVICIETIKHYIDTLVGKQLKTFNGGLELFRFEGIFYASRVFADYSFFMLCTHVIIQQQYNNDTTIIITIVPRITNKQETTSPLALKILV